MQILKVINHAIQAGREIRLQLSQTRLRMMVMLARKLLRKIEKNFELEYLCFISQRVVKRGFSAMGVQSKLSSHLRRAFTINDIGEISSEYATT